MFTFPDTQILSKHRGCHGGIFKLTCARGFAITFHLSVFIDFILRFHTFHRFCNLNFHDVFLAALNTLLPQTYTYKSRYQAFQLSYPKNTMRELLDVERRKKIFPDWFNLWRITENYFCRSKNLGCAQSWKSWIRISNHWK